MGAMLSPATRARLDALRSRFWSAGLSNPLTVVEQISHLLFLRRLDEGAFCGPACGTGGFLLGAHQHAGAGLALEGLELDPAMARLGAMNLALHGAEARVARADALSEGPAGPYDLVLANPPFQGSFERPAA